MRLLCTLLLLLLSARLFAQRVTGLVIDRVTKQPLTYAKISSPKLLGYTNYAGCFSIKPKPGDTALITLPGYKPYHLIIGYKKQDTIRIYMEQISIMLKGTTISKRRDFTADSMQNRKDFAAVFAHKEKGIKDAFIAHHYNPYLPYDQISSPNTATSIVSVNVLSVIGLFNKNKQPVTKLQKILLSEEESTFVDHRFTRQRVSNITALKGDSLRVFMDRYRPPIDSVKEMTDYELLLYIKKCYASYRTSTEKATSPLFKE